PFHMRPLLPRRSNVAWSSWTNVSHAAGGGIGPSTSPVAGSHATVVRRRLRSVATNIGFDGVGAVSETSFTPGYAAFRRAMAVAASVGDVVRVSRQLFGMRRVSNS